jgi:malonyl-CoA O-methyltransferase
VSVPDPPASIFATHVLDQARVRRAFDRAASTYDAAAVLHADVRDNLLGRLDWTKVVPKVVLDLGAGTGHGSRALKRRYPKALVVAIDTSQRMLAEAGRRQTWLRRFGRLHADAERLPLADGSVDLVFSNLLLEWCDPDAVFRECRRVLAPQGLLCFSTFGPDTLRELRSAWQQVDSHPHVHQFIDMHDLGDALVRAGFAAPVLDVERYTLRYTDLRHVAWDLKATGSGNAASDRRRGLTGRARIAALQAAYETFRRDGRLPATYEVVFGHAWGPAAAVRGESSQTSSVSLEEIKQQLRRRRGSAS